jgi:hypothetical protein
MVGNACALDALWRARLNNPLSDMLDELEDILATFVTRYRRF